MKKKGLQGGMTLLIFCNYLELGVLTKNVTVMFLIVLDEAALR
jgi:hypothetical protein